MPRTSKPWYWKERDAWYAWHKGKRHMLAKGKRSNRVAYEEFLRITKVQIGEHATRAVSNRICSIFLEFAQVNLKPKTHEGYKWFIEKFADHIGSLDGNAVQPKHVSAFLDAQINWGKTTRYNAITAIKRAWGWAHDEGHITVNQLRKMKRPKPERRTEIPDDKEIAAFIAHAKPEFMELLTFIRETGCRPGEAAMIEKRHVDLLNLEVRFKIGEDKTSGKTNKPRVIHLNDTALAMIQKLVALFPAGSLFRNSKGRRWTRSAMDKAAERARGLAGLDDDRAVPYAVRHQYITDALARGVPIALVAEMTGTSPEMIAKVYSHISEKKRLLLDAANLIRPS